MEDECNNCKQETQIALLGEKLENYSKAIKENTDLTQEIFNRLCVDKPDCKSMQSQIVILKQKVAWQWTLSAVILTSLLGVSFFLIQENLKEKTPDKKAEKIEKVKVAYDRKEKVALLQKRLGE